ncbi:class I SAM-dependent methyltransferase [Hydrogenophaga aquatica]
MDHPLAHNAAIVPGLDPVASGRWRAMSRQGSPWLHEEVGGRMVDRLGWFKQVPQDWLDWSPLLGGLATHRRLRDVYPDAGVWIAGDQAAQAAKLLGRRGGARAAMRQPFKWWASAPRVLADGEAAELAEMVWANMALHLTHDPRSLLQRWRQLLRVGGFLMFSSLGPDTLREVRAVYAQKGWHPPAHALTDMHDWGDMLVETGFAEPVMDMERLTLTYPNAERLLQDLRDWGRNLHTERPRGLLGRGHRQALVDALESGLPRTGEGLLSVTVEVVYGHAFKAAPKVKVAPSSTVSVDDMRAMLRGGGAR